MISVIVPVYNAPHLEDTMRSILSQTYRDIEVICVDDGSTDGSGEELARWAGIDGRVRVISQANGGLSVARNSGLDAAKGDWIAFVDAGDILREDALEVLHNAAVAADAEVAVSRSFAKASTVAGVMRRLNASARASEPICHSRPIEDTLRYRYVFSSVCNKLYRRTAIGDLRFQKGIFFEDWPFVTKLFGMIRRFVLVEEPLYGYVMSAGSITRSEFSAAKVKGYVAGIESVYGFYAERGAVPRAVLRRCGIAAKMMLNKVWHSRAALPELQSLALAEFWRLVRERKVLLRDVAFKAKARAFIMDYSAGRNSRGIWFFALALWFLFSVLACVFYPVMMSDSVSRYAPMAEAFAAGNWNLAFHPRFGVLFQVLAGSIVALTGLDGDRALQVAAFGMQALSLVPIWCLSRKMFGGRIAWLAALLVFFGDDLFRYSLDGLRDSGKCLGFALLGLGIAERKSIWYGAGLFILISLASYCFAVGMLFFFGWCVYAFSRREWKMLLWPAAGSVLGTASVTVMVHAYTGHWLPAPHYIRYLGGWL